jgi:hypothetical protein
MPTRLPALTDPATRRRIAVSLAGLLAAVPLAALQTVHLPPRASTSGPKGFSTVYASRGEGNLFFGMRVTYGRRGFQAELVPGSVRDLDRQAVDRAVDIIVARHRLRRAAPPPPSNDPMIK